MSSMNTPEMQSKEASWNQLQAKLNQNKGETLVRKMPWLIRRGWAVAAAVIAVVAVFFFNPDEQTRVASKNDIEIVTLPDGSRVTLNENSEIAYNPSWENRVIELKGEAFFEVKKGERFTVKTTLGDVQVLGTSFNVFAEEGMFMVDCYTGKVEVNHEDEQVTLTKGLATRMKEGSLMIPHAHSKSEIVWNKDGAFFYENTPILKVFADFERAFDVEIQSADLNKNCTWNGEAANITEAMAIICKPHGLNFSLQGSIVVVK